MIWADSINGEYHNVTIGLYECLENLITMGSDVRILNKDTRKTLFKHSSKSNVKDDFAFRYKNWYVDTIGVSKEYPGELLIYANKKDENYYDLQVKNGIGLTPFI